MKWFLVVVLWSNEPVTLEREYSFTMCHTVGQSMLDNKLGVSYKCIPRGGRDL